MKLDKTICKTISTILVYKKTHHAISRIQRLSSSRSSIQSKCAIRKTRWGRGRMGEKFTVAQFTVAQFTGSEKRCWFTTTCHYKGLSLTELTHFWTITLISFTKKPACRTYAGSNDELFFVEAPYTKLSHQSTVPASQVTAANVEFFLVYWAYIPLDT